MYCFVVLSDFFICFIFLFLIYVYFNMIFSTFSNLKSVNFYFCVFFESPYSEMKQTGNHLDKSLTFLG